MDRLKEFFLKNNYLALKITGAVLTAGVAITAVTLIVTGDKGTETSTNDKGSSAIETTVDVAQNVSTEDGSTENQVSNDTQDVTSSEEETTTFDGELTSDEESISTKELALGNDNTTTTQNNGATESKTQEQTTSKVVTTQKPSSSKQQVTSSQAQTTTTQAPTTTQKPTTTTTPIETTTQEVVLRYNYGHEMLNRLYLSKRSSTLWQKIKDLIHQNLNSRLWSCMRKLVKV